MSYTTSRTGSCCPRWLERVAWAWASLLVALFLTCLHLTTTAPFHLATFSRLVGFDAVEPFQHRILLPAIVAGIQTVLPLGETLLFGLFEIAGWMALIALAYRALVLFEIGTSTLMRRVLAFTIIIPMFMHLIAPDLQLVSAFVTNERILDVGTWHPRALFYYVYDLPAAAFTLAMMLVLAQQARAPNARGLALYFVLFAIATFNRETTLFLIPLFALLLWPVLSPQRWLALLVLQCALFAAIQLPLAWLFAGNVNPNGRLAGTQYEYHLWHNLGLLSNPLYLLTFCARFAAGLYIPILLWRHYLDRRLALALLVFGVPLAFFALIVGRVQEQRIFIEIIPLIWVGAMQTIAARSSIVQASVAQTESARDVGHMSLPPAHNTSVANTTTAQIDRVARRRAGDMPG